MNSSGILHYQISLCLKQGQMYLLLQSMLQLSEAVGHHHFTQSDYEKSLNSSLKVRRPIVLFNHPSLFLHERQRQLRNFKGLGNRNFAEHGPTQTGVSACVSGRQWGEGELGNVRKLVGEAYKSSKGSIVGWRKSQKESLEFLAKRTLVPRK